MTIDDLWLARLPPVILGRRIGQGWCTAGANSMGMFETTGRTYDYIVRLVREYGVYPLDLKEKQPRA